MTLRIYKYHPVVYLIRNNVIWHVSQLKEIESIRGQSLESTESQMLKEDHRCSETETAIKDGTVRKERVV